MNQAIELAAWCASQGHGNPKTHSMLAAVARLKHVDPCHHTIYLQSAADVANVTKFPFLSQVRKKRRIEDTDSESEDSEQDTCDTESRIVQIRPDTYYSVQTVEGSRRKTSIETSYFRANHDGSITWMYTWTQLKRAFLDAHSCDYPKKPSDFALYSSTHIQEDIKDLYPFAEVKVVPGPSSSDYWIAGVFVVETVEVLSVDVQKDHPNVEGYIDTLLARGSHSPDRLKRALQGNNRWSSHDTKPSKGTCHVCGLQRSLTKVVKLGCLEWHTGDYCYKRIHLAHRLIHHPRSAADVVPLLEEFASLV